MLRRGDRFGRWQTTRRLGRGGNGEVWEVRGANGELRAIKILDSRKHDGHYRLARFRDEIRFLTEHAGHPGVLPLIDSRLYDDPAKLSWYVMPIAIRVNDALGHDPKPEAVTAAIANVAETLAALAADGIGHRDVKPDNLFRLGEEWVIGDFGLVTYPEKRPLTQQGRKLGPIDYMAPEMRENADQARPEPADVWALSKTLWVLLTGASYPLPGPHRPADPAYSLSERISFDRAGELDLLLERATRIDPTTRESLAGFARELRACLALPPEIVTSSTLQELQDRITALTTTEYQQLAESRDWVQRVDKAYAGLKAVLDESYEALAEQLPSFTRDAPTSGWPDLLERPNAATGPPWGSWSMGRQLLSPGIAPRAVVSLNAGMQIWQKNGPADIAAELKVEHRYNTLAHSRVMWADTYAAPIDSAQQAQAFAVIRAGFHSVFPDAMRWIAEILAGRSVVRDWPDGRWTLEIHPMSGA